MPCGRNYNLHFTSIYTKHPHKLRLFGVKALICCLVCNISLSHLHPGYIKLNRKIKVWIINIRKTQCQGSCTLQHVVCEVLSEIIPAACITPCITSYYTLYQKLNQLLHPVSEISPTITPCMRKYTSYYNLYQKLHQLLHPV